MSERAKPKAMPCTYCRGWSRPPAAVRFHSQGPFLWKGGRNSPLLLFFVQETWRPSLGALQRRKPWPTHGGQPKKESWEMNRSPPRSCQHLGKLQVGFWQRAECEFRNASSRKCREANSWEIPRFLLKHKICLLWIRNIYLYFLLQGNKKWVTNFILM